MSTSEVESILTKVERLSTDDKKLLIKRVVDLLGEGNRRPKTRRTVNAGRRRKTGVRPSQQRAALDEEIAAYALASWRRADSRPGSCARSRLGGHNEQRRNNYVDDRRNTCVTVR